MNEQNHALTLPRGVTAGDVRLALNIRRFEERLLTLFSEGLLNGTVHTYIGQEFAAVSVLRNFAKGDWVVSNHRGHGHFLAVTENYNGLMAEIMGRSTGVCRGIGGSQHLYADGFVSNGIQGGMTAVAVGMALANRSQNPEAIVFAFIGDGTLGEGALYEALNMSSLRKAPVMWVVENNGYAQSTDTKTTIAGSIAARAQAFGIPFYSGNVWDLERLFSTASEAVAAARTVNGPVMLEVTSYRLKAHSKGDDNRATEEIKSYEEKDPLLTIRRSYVGQFDRLDEDAVALVDAAVDFAKNSPHCDYRPPTAAVGESRIFKEIEFGPARGAQQIYEGLRLSLEGNERLSILGEDIEGHYGGAFKVTKDLSILFPGRVTNAPISESAIVGVCTGAALMGAPAVAEIMFGDFLTLTFDQLYQHAGKFSAMYAGQVNVPLVVRTPMGGRRGYGPTHSQSIEKHFIGIPGVTVVATNHRMDLRSFYSSLLAKVSSPHVIIENKIQYTRPGDLPLPVGYKGEISNGEYPVVRLHPPGKADVSILCYGGMLEEVEAALSELLMQDELLAEVICPSRLGSADLHLLTASVARTGAFLSAEEGSAVGGMGALACSDILAAGVACRVKILGYEGMIPANLSQELRLLCGRTQIADEVRKLVNGNP